MATPASASPTSRRRPTLLAAGAASLALALALAGCGGSGGGDEDADPASVAPRNTAIYMTAYVRPEGEDAEAVESIVKKVTGAADPGREIERLVNRGFTESGGSGPKLNYEDDVKPWLGRRAAVAITRFTRGDESSGAFIVAAKDTDKAKDAIDKAAESERGTRDRSYKDVDYKVDSDRDAIGVVGDFVVGGAEADVRSVIDASKGQSLEDNSQYSKVAGQSEENLGFGYVDVRGLVDALGASGQLPLSGETLRSAFGGANPQPVTLELEAEPNKVTLEASAQMAKGAPKSNAGKLVTTLPGDSWVALGAGDLGRALRQAIRQYASGGVGGGVVQTLRQQLRRVTGIDLDRDLLAALGDVGVFVRGTSLLQLGGGLVIDTPDPSAARRLVTKVGRLIASQGRGQVRVSNTTVGGASGIAVSGVGPVGTVNVVVGRGKLVAAYGDAATREALSPSRQLGNTPAFQQASASLGGATPALFVEFGPIANLAGAQAGPEVRRYLNALTTAAAGARTEGNRQVARFVINLK